MQQRIDPEQIEKKDAQFTGEIVFAHKSETHLWMAVQVHVMTVATLEKMVGDPLLVEPLLLDLESLRTVSIGCFVCEEPYERRRAQRKCPGEPK